MPGQPGNNRVRRIGTIASALAVVAIAACGGGGGGGGGSALQVLDEATFLLSDGGPDPRTGQLFQFVLRDRTNPIPALVADDVEVRRDGALDTEARVRVNPADVDKASITLILDVSSSLSPADLQKLKTSAQEFAQDILPLVSVLRIYYFSSPSQTRLLGEYRAVPAGGGSVAWSPDPDPDIDAIPGGDNSTALFHAVRRAILEDPERDDILVVFSDGKENSSPLGARNEALDLIENEKIVVFSLGFGSVDQADLRALSAPFGTFLGVRPSLVGLFAQVAGEIQSVYTVVYDTPAAFGSHRLDVKVRAGGRRWRHSTLITAGVDLARAAYGRFPMLPGSSVELTDFTKSPPESLTYTVLDTDQAVTGADGLFAFAVESSHACPGIDCVLSYQGPYGQGARDENGNAYLPAQLIAGESWQDPISGEEFTFVGFQTLDFFRGTGNLRRYRCAKVTFAGGTHWFAPEIGLVRTRNGSGTTLLEIARPPCLADGFDGGCSVR